MTVINLDKNVKITTFGPSPKLDPLTASATSLAEAGLPPRPTDPHLLARYTRFFTKTKNKFHYIEPTFRIDPTKTTHANKDAEYGAGADAYDNWSGGVVHAPDGQSFKWVEGDWVVPSVYPTAQNEWQYCANWVGIDGDGSGDVCQAGMICAVYQSGSFITRSIYPWHEWYPSSWVEITNLSISSGDFVSVLICSAQGARSRTATIYFANHSSGGATSYQITAPLVTALGGTSAEWVVEAPFVNGSLSQMPDYGEAFFYVCEAGLTNGSVVNGVTGNNINLAQNGTTLSTGTLSAPAVVDCRYAGSVP
jgi:hypothetical protein